MKRVLGIGTAYMMIAELMFVLSNYLIHLGVARYLGPEIYGLFGVLMSLFFLNKAFLNTGIPRTVSKFAAEPDVHKPSLFKRILQLQFFLALLFGSFYCLFSSRIASFLHDSSLTSYLWFLGLLVLPTSLLSLYLNGYFNGLRKFKHQSFVKIVHSILRLIFVFIFILLGFKLWAVLFGYVLAMVVAIFVGRSLLKSILRKDKNETKLILPLKKLILFSLPVTISALAFTSIKNVSTLLVKYFLQDNLQVGLFTAASTLANISFMVFLSLSVTLMPSISKSVSSQNLPLTQKYISESLRYLLLLALPLTVLIAATAKELLTLFYSSAYASAWPLLSILIFGSTFLALFQTLTAVISGSGKPKIEMGILLFFILILVLFSYVLLPPYGLNGAAISFSAAAFISLLLAGTYVYFQFRVLLNFLSFLRISACSLIVFAVTYFWSSSGWNLVLTYFLLFLFYLSLLIFTGEIKREDWNRTRQLLFSFRKKQQLKP